jgi:ethanolamine phosphate phosphodiesterase
VFIDAPGLVGEDRERARHGYAFGGPDSENDEGKGGWSAIPGGTVEFVRQFAAGQFILLLALDIETIADVEHCPEKHDKPTVLFTHIPLSRPDGTDCGPLREKGTIHRGAGFGYENTFSEEASNFLLQNIRPSIIFR